MAGPTHHPPALPVFDRPPKLLIVVAPYYLEIANELIAGARATIEGGRGTHELVEVPGALVRIPHRHQHRGPHVELRRPMSPSAA